MGDDRTYRPRSSVHKTVDRMLACTAPRSFRCVRPIECFSLIQDPNSRSLRVTLTGAICGMHAQTGRLLSRVLGRTMLAGRLSEKTISYRAKHTTRSCTVGRRGMAGPLSSLLAVSLTDLVHSARVEDSGRVGRCVSFTG